MRGSAAVVLLSLVSASLLVFVGWFLMNYRTSPAERERKRRIRLNLSGRITDGEVLELEQDLLIYSYEVAGVVYSTTQDISELRADLPRDPLLIIGPATVKYLTRDPGNSIVVCEEWSGLRSRRRLVVGERKGA
jgi:hypothetical protein